MNYNKDITLRELFHADLYEGMYVQSFGNTDYIYRVVMRDVIYLRTSHRVVSGLLIVDNCPTLVHGGRCFCETIHTRELNIDYIRNYKLIELGI
jgi:hypothetical protein